MHYYIKLQVATLLTITLASCASRQNFAQSPNYPNFRNPFPPGSHEHFKADPSYPQTSDVYFNEKLLLLTNATNSNMIVCISKQRGSLMNGDEVVIDYPVSTGKPSHPTPAGNYRIVEKIAEKSSNAYGVVYDHDGQPTGEETPENIPAGGKFVGAPMPYWMRLTWAGIGHHVGNVPRYAASHACIRGPDNVVPIVFSKTKVGTRFTIEN